MGKSGGPAWTQSPGRDKAERAMERYFRAPGGRFDRMLTLAERNACDEEFIDEIPGIDEATIDLCRKIVRGETANFGSEECSLAARSSPYRHKGPKGARTPSSRDRMCTQMYRGGQSINRIAGKTGLSWAGVKMAIDRYTQWEDERGSGEHAGTGGRENAGADRVGD